MPPENAGIITKIVADGKEHAIARDALITHGSVWIVLLTRPVHVQKTVAITIEGLRPAARARVVAIGPKLDATADNSPAPAP